MISRFVLVSVFVLFAFSVAAFCADIPQKEGEVLMDRARQVSDIRQPGSPSFRLKASFSFIGDDLDTVEGTYSELWVSDSQWRREIVVGDLRRTEVGTATRTWILDSSPRIPERALHSVSVVDVFPPVSSKFVFESLTSVLPDDTATECVVTKANSPTEGKHAFCFDRKTGVLIENVTPQVVRTGVADYSCAYAAFQKFGDKWFPRKARCLLSGHNQMELEVVELSAESFDDVALFKPPAGALEIGRCLSGTLAPKLVFNPDPPFPHGEREHGSLVLVRLVVDIEGKPQDVYVVRTGGSSFDDIAVHTVQRWRFKPATCNGEPMPAQVMLQVLFLMQR